MITWILLPLLSASIAVACGWVVLLLQGRNRRALANMACGGSNGVPGSIGISVLCSGEIDPMRIEQLLAVEYARYEVIVVLDACHYAEAYALLAAQYRMIRVEWRPSCELHTDGIRALARSRKRCFRRLVIVDRVGGDLAGDFNAAAAVASFDYLMPIGAGCRMLPQTVERLLSVLQDDPSAPLEWIGTHVGVPACVVSREAVVAAGGFGRGVLRGIARSKRRWLWEPLLRKESQKHGRGGWLVAVGWGSVAVFALCIVMGAWMWASVAITGVTLILALGCVRRLIGEMR